MRIFFLSESQKNFASFLSLNVGIGPFSTHVKSVSDLLRILPEALDMAIENFVLVQAPVVLPKNYLEDLKCATSSLDSNWPNWAACGAEGHTLDRVGVNQDSWVSFSGSPVSFPTDSRVVFPAAEISRDLIVFRGCKFPLEQIQALIINNVKEFFQELGHVFARENSSLLLVPEVSYYKLKDSSDGADYSLCLSGKRDGIIAGIAEAKDKKTTLAIVTRTRFRNVDQLQRATLSSASFRKSQYGAGVVHYVVSDSTPPESFVIESGCTLVEFPAVAGDSRFYLIKKIVDHVEADYFLFLDDDDALLERHADEILSTVSAYPSNSIFHFGSVYFVDNPFVTIGKVNLESPRKNVKSGFVKTAFMGVNQTPFSATIWPRTLLENTPDKAFEGITLLEDYFLLLSSWTSGLRPVFVDYDLPAISISKEGNVVNSGTDLEWIQARANLAAHLSRSMNWRPLFGQELKSRNQVTGNQGKTFSLRKILKMNLLKAALDQKIFLRLLRRQITVKELIHKIKLVLEA